MREHTKPLLTEQFRSEYPAHMFSEVITTQPQPKPEKSWKMTTYMDNAICIYRGTYGEFVVVLLLSIIGR